MIDREIVCLDARGRSNFKSLLFRRKWPYFYTFDLLAHTTSRALWASSQSVATMPTA